MKYIILDPQGRCYWKPERRGYGSLIEAGIYDAEEALGIEALARGDKAIPIDTPWIQKEVSICREGAARFDDAMKEM